MPSPFSFSPLRIATLAVALALAPLLGACTGFSPVYGPSSVTTQGVAIAYGVPAGRLEQVIYEDLALRLGRNSPGAPKLTITTSSSTVSLTERVVRTANYQKQVKVTARIRLTAADGKVLFSGSRSETADYTDDRQVLANDQAQTEAAERAAHLLADTIRLTILGALAQ
jgi:hypothetical protein